MFKETYKYVINNWPETLGVEHFSGRIIERKRRFEKRTPHGKWHLVEDDTTEIRNVYYMNSLDAHQLAIFSDGGRETIGMGYTFVGYIPVTITSYSPDRTVKIVRDYKFEKGEEK